MKPNGGSRTPIAAQRKAKAIELWGLGLAQSQIAERLGVSRSAVGDYLSDILKTGHRVAYADCSGGGSGRSGFAGNMARRT